MKQLITKLMRPLIALIALLFVSSSADAWTVSLKEYNGSTEIFLDWDSSNNRWKGEIPANSNGKNFNLKVDSNYYGWNGGSYGVNDGTQGELALTQNGYAFQINVSTKRYVLVTVGSNEGDVKTIQFLKDEPKEYDYYIRSNISNKDNWANNKLIKTGDKYAVTLDLGNGRDTNRSLGIMPTTKGTETQVNDGGDCNWYAADSDATLDASQEKEYTLKGNGTNFTVPSGMKGKWVFEMSHDGTKPTKLTVKPESANAEYTVFYYDVNDEPYESGVRAHVYTSSYEAYKDWKSSEEDMTNTGKYVKKGNNYYPVWSYTFTWDKVPAFVMFHYGSSDDAHIDGTVNNGTGLTFHNYGFYSADGYDTQTYDLVDRADVPTYRYYLHHYNDNGKVDTEDLITPDEAFRIKGIQGQKFNIIVKKKNGQIEEQVAIYTHSKANVTPTAGTTADYTLVNTDQAYDISLDTEIAGTYVFTLSVDAEGMPSSIKIATPANTSFASNAPERLFLKHSYIKFNGNWETDKAYEFTKNDDGTFSVIVPNFKAQPGAQNLGFKMYSLVEDGTHSWEWKENDKVINSGTNKKYKIDKWYSSGNSSKEFGFASGQQDVTIVDEENDNVFWFNDGTYSGPVEVVVDFTTPTPKVSVKEGASRYYFIGDMNQWFSRIFVSEPNFLATGDNYTYTYKDNNTAKDVSANGDAMDRNLLWQTKEKWQMTPTTYNGESGWYKISFKELAGQFQIFDGNAWNDGTFSHKIKVENYNDNNTFKTYFTQKLELNGVENDVKIGQGSNFHLPCNSVKDATIYFNPTKKKLIVNGTRQNYFVFYDREGDKSRNATDNALRAHINSEKPNKNNYYIPFNNGLTNVNDDANHMNNAKEEEWESNGFTMHRASGLDKMTKTELTSLFPNATDVVESILNNKRLPNGVHVEGRDIWYAKIPNGFEYPAGTKFTLFFGNSLDGESWENQTKKTPYYTTIGLEHLYFFDGIHMHVNTEDFDQIAEVKVEYRIYTHDKDYKTVTYDHDEKKLLTLADAGKIPETNDGQGWVVLDMEHKNATKMNWSTEYNFTGKDNFRVKYEEAYVGNEKHLGRRPVPAGLSTSYVQFKFTYSPKVSQSSQRKASWQTYSVYVPALPTMEQDDNEIRLKGVDHFYALDLNSDVATGIEDILDWEDGEFDGELDGEEAAPVYYNLQGVRVANPTKGLYIKVTGSKSEKVMF